MVSESLAIELVLISVNEKGRPWLVAIELIMGGAAVPLGSGLNCLIAPSWVAGSLSLGEMYWEPN